MTGPSPYAPPSAEVFDAVEPAATGGEYLNPEGRSCPAGRGWRWYGDAWRIFKVQPFMWWLALVISFGGSTLLGLIPFAKLLTTVLIPILAAGTGSCARSVLRDGRFKIGQVFDGFRIRPATLLIAGVIYLVVESAAMGIVMLAFGVHGLFDILFGGRADSHAATQMLVTMGAGFWIAYIFAFWIVATTIVFSRYLIQEHGVSAPQALLMSAKGCLKNIPDFLVSIFSLVVFAILATIPIGLGWLALIPMLFLMQYVAYRDIFLTDVAGA